MRPYGRSTPQGDLGGALPPVEQAARVTCFRPPVQFETVTGRRFGRSGRYCVRQSDGPLNIRLAPDEALADTCFNHRQPEVQPGS